jgi:hypothetical protein
MRHFSMIFFSKSFLYHTNTVQQLSLIVSLLFLTRRMKPNTPLRVEKNRTSLYHMYLLLKKLALLFRRQWLAEKQQFLQRKWFARRTT